MTCSRHDLSHGWQFREANDSSSNENPWLPVQSVPTQVHIDLLANKKYAGDLILHKLYLRCPAGSSQIQIVTLPLAYAAIGYQTPF